MGMGEGHWSGMPSFFSRMPLGPIQGVGQIGIHVSQNYSSSVAPVLSPWGEAGQWVATAQLVPCSERQGRWGVRT